MNNYYDYIFGIGNVPDFKVEDPDSDKFDDLITKVSEYRENSFFENIKNRMENLYISLVEGDFLYTYLILDVPTTDEQNNDSEVIALGITIETLFKFRHVTPVEKEEYIERLKRIQFIRQFVNIEYKQSQDIEYGSLDTVISDLQEGIWHSIQRGPIERWLRKPEEEQYKRSYEKNRQLDLDSTPEKRPRIGL